MKGTGVPLTRMKCVTDHSIRDSPIARIGTETMSDDAGRSLVNPQSLSTQRERTTNSVTRLTKKSPPTKVSGVLTWRLLVAAL